jgi:hypothetical protein
VSKREIMKHKEEKGRGEMEEDEFVCSIKVGDSIAPCPREPALAGYSSDSLWLAGERLRLTTDGGSRDGSSGEDRRLKTRRSNLSTADLLTWRTVMSLTPEWLLSAEVMSL